MRGYRPKFPSDCWDSKSVITKTRDAAWHAQPCMHWHACVRHAVCSCGCMERCEESARRPQESFQTRKMIKIDLLNHQGDQIRGTKFFITKLSLQPLYSMGCITSCKAAPLGAQPRMT